MGRALLAVVLTALAGCPPRKAPERGVELVFTKSGDVRLAVERRLARLGVKARLADDETTITVRLPQTGAPVDVAAVKALLSVPAKLEFCKEAAQPSRAHCEAPAPADGGAPGPDVERVPDDFDEGHCMVLGREPAALFAAVDAGTQGRVLVGAGRGGQLRTYVAEPGCLAPRVLRAEVSTELPVVNIVFDG
ncbi:MAG: hypothetical protein INH37_03390, partial [Myxococcaceae bacterium]|nr:hypothetical protein [Myxococcaceae bacterium]